MDYTTTTGWHLVRHGETRWNRDGRIQGHADAELSERGRQQMHRLAERLAGCKFAAVYASDLGRAVQSADLIVEGRGVSVETDSDLRELSYGAWEGLTQEEAEALAPADYAARMAMDGDAFAAPGGETRRELFSRVRAFYERTAARHSSSGSILVVAHTGSIRALLICILGLPDDCFWRFRVDHGSLSIVSNHPQGSTLELWNAVPHVPGSEGVRV